MITNLKLIKTAPIFALLILQTALISFSAAQERKLGVQHESEAGMVVVSGNASAQTLSAAQKTGFNWTRNNLVSVARYTRATANGVESVKNWLGSLRYERKISENFLSGLLAQTVEGNKYSGFMQRQASDLGAKVVWKDDKSWTLMNEAGYRYQRQRNSDSTVLRHSYGRLYGEVVKPVHESFSLKAWLEYLPNFTTRPDWQMNGEVSATAVMTSIFSLKTAYLVRYDNVPNGTAQFKSDKIFTTSLVAKF